MFRQFRRNPWFAAAAVASLALGLGSATAAWGVVEALLLRSPVGIGEADRVVDLGRTVGGRGFDSFSYPEIGDLRERATTLASVAAWGVEPMSLASGGAGERVVAMAVSPSYFDVMGLGAAIAGRYFGAEADVAPGAHPVAVLGHRTWLERFGGERSVIGRTILLNRHPFEVVGVAPAGFHGHQAGVEPDVYVPILMMGVVRSRVANFDARRSSWVRAVARLAPGATVESADADVKRVFDGLRPLDPALYEHRSAAAVPLRAMPGAVRPEATTFLGLLLGLVGLVLLVTCANVAGMLLARGAAREKEIAVRLAIGAGRGRLVRHLLGESLALFVVGGAAGLLLAVWILRALSAAALPGPVPIRLDFAPNLGVFAAGLGVALLAGTLFGLAPALQSTRPDLVSALKGVAGTASRARLRRAFVAAQVGLSLALLLAAGLFLRSLQRAGSIDAGFDGAGVQTVAFDLSIDGYDRDRGLAALDRLLEEARALPGVEAAGLAQDLPLDLGINETSFYPEDGAGTDTDGSLGAAFVVASDGYLEALRIPVLRGRAFEAADRPASARVVLVSGAFADRVWPGDAAVGKRLRFASRDGELRTVVGVVADVKQQSHMESAQPTVYLPVAQSYQSALTLVARSATGAPPAARALIDAIRRVDPALSLTSPATLNEITAIGLLPQRLASFVATTLGLLAALLAALGVYGIVAYQVARRAREIGIRTALGAGRRQTVRHVVAGGVRLAAPGLAVGVAAGLAIGRVARGFILGVTPADPLVFLVAPAAMLAVLLAATWTPAHRASRIEPMSALRAE